MKIRAPLHASLTACFVLAGLTLAPLSFADEQALDNPPVAAPADEGGIAETPPPVDIPVTDEVADQGGPDVGTPPQVDEPVAVEVPVVDDGIVPTRGVEGMPEGECINCRSNDNLPAEGDVEALSYNMAPGGGVSENSAPVVPEASIEAANAALAATTAQGVFAQDDATVEPVATPDALEARIDDKQLGAGNGPVIRDGHLIAR
jgi:hypothetical protein